MYCEILSNLCQTVTNGVWTSHVSPRIPPKDIKLMLGEKLWAVFISDRGQIVPLDMALNPYRRQGLSAWNGGEGW